MLVSRFASRLICASCTEVGVGRVEDPSEPWQDTRGNWHVLFHAESPSGAPWARSGGHAFSRKGDGRHWTCKTSQDSVPRFAQLKRIAFSDTGTAFTTGTAVWPSAPAPV